MATVKFHNQLFVETNEVDDIGTNGFLPAEFEPVLLPFLKVPPQQVFRGSRMFPQFTSEKSVHDFVEGSKLKGGKY
jgi:hypothetical protein